MTGAFNIGGQPAVADGAFEQPQHCRSRSGQVQLDRRLRSPRRTKRMPAGDVDKAVADDRRGGDVKLAHDLDPHDVVLVTGIGVGVATAHGRGLRGVPFPG